MKVRELHIPVAVNNQLTVTHVKMAESKIELNLDTFHTDAVSQDEGRFSFIKSMVRQLSSCRIRRYDYSNISREFDSYARSSDFWGHIWGCDGISNSESCE